MKNLLNSFADMFRSEKEVINSLKTYSGREVMSSLETCSGQKRGYEQFNDIFGSACEVRTV